MIISAMICTEGPKLGNKKVYLMLKEAVLQALDNSRELSDEELMESIEAELARRDKRMLLPFGQRRQYAKALFASFRKFGVIQELVEDDEETGFWLVVVGSEALGECVGIRQAGD